MDECYCDDIANQLTSLIILLHLGDIGFFMALYEKYVDEMCMFDFSLYEEQQQLQQQTDETSSTIELTINSPGLSPSRVSMLL